jgi:LacI family transcriptional regulator
MSMQRVAELAGVSTSTVSRVFHDDPCVAADTAAAVRLVVQQLGFIPARRKRRNNGNGSNRLDPVSDAIAFLVLGTSGSNATPGFEKLLRAVSDAANANDLSIVLSFVSDPAHIPPRLLDRQLAGVLCHGDQPGATGLAHLRTLPTVWLMANRHRPRWGDQVMPNNAVIGDMAGRYLIRRGHRRVAYLGIGPDGWSMRQRSFAFGKAAEDAGATCRVIEAPATVSGDYWCADGLASAAESIVDQLLDGTPMPTGLFVAEDRLLPVIDRALRARGIRHGAIAASHNGNGNGNGHANGNVKRNGNGHAISDDAAVEIISCNNEQPHYAGLSAQPARIDIRPEAIGRRGVEQLLWRIRTGNDVPERMRVMVDPVLIEPDGAQTNGNHVLDEPALLRPAEVNLISQSTPRAHPVPH